MNKSHILITVLFIMLTQLSFAASFTLYNNTGKPLEVTARWGNEGAYETTTLLDGEKYTFSAFLQYFYQLVWRSIDEGVYHNLDIVSTRLMKDGAIEIKPQGRYIINFNTKGVYPFPQVERGVSPIRKGYPTGMYQQ